MNYFQVELDDNPGAHYAKYYDSILLYTDNIQTGISRFHLHNVAQVQAPKYLGLMVDNDYTAYKVTEYNNHGNGNKEDNNDASGSGGSNHNDNNPISFTARLQQRRRGRK